MLISRKVTSPYYSGQPGGMEHRNSGLLFKHWAFFFFS